MPAPTAQAARRGAARRGVRNNKFIYGARGAQNETSKKKNTCRGRRAGWAGAIARAAGIFPRRASLSARDARHRATTSVRVARKESKCLVQ